MDDDAELEVLYTSSTSVVLDAMGTALIKERKVAIAEDYRLKQNYPNPFNPSTTITFHIPSNQIVNLSIYDLQGKQVATLLNRSLSEGSYDLLWSGLDNNRSSPETWVKKSLKYCWVIVCGFLQVAEPVFVKKRGYFVLP